MLSDGLPLFRVTNARHSNWWPPFIGPSPHPFRWFSSYWLHRGTGVDSRCPYRVIVGKGKGVYGHRNKVGGGQLERTHPRAVHSCHRSNATHDRSLHLLGHFCYLACNAQSARTADKPSSGKPGFRHLIILGNPNFPQITFSEIRTSGVFDSRKLRCSS
jgi:hypothetical protein